MRFNNEFIFNLFDHRRKRLGWELQNQNRKAYAHNIEEVDSRISRT